MTKRTAVMKEIRHNLEQVDSDLKAVLEAAVKSSFQELTPHQPQVMDLPDFKCGFQPIAIPPPDLEPLVTKLSALEVALLGLKASLTDKTDVSASLSRQVQAIERLKEQASDQGKLLLAILNKAAPPALKCQFEKSPPAPEPDQFLRKLHLVLLMLLLFCSIITLLK